MAVDLYVQEGANNSIADGSATYPYSQIQYAIDAIAPDTDNVHIHVGPGSYMRIMICNSNGLRFNSLFIQSTTPRAAVIDGSGIYTPVFVYYEETVAMQTNNANITIDGFKICNGNAYLNTFTTTNTYYLNSSNGLLTESDTLRIIEPGGGIFVRHVEEITIRNCEIFNNQAATGAAIYGIGTSVSQTPKLNLINCYIHDNSCKRNGMCSTIETKTVDVNISECSIINNGLTVNNNGIMLRDYSILHFDHLRENRIHNVTISKTLIADNWAQSCVLQSEVIGGSIMISSSTISNNQIYGVSDAAIKVSSVNFAFFQYALIGILNSIVRDNYSNKYQDVSLPALQRGYGRMRFDLKNSDLSGIGSFWINNMYDIVEDNIDEDPCFVDKSNGDYSLRWDSEVRSPCIMSGFDEEVSSRYDRTDMGYIQYDEYPHEYITYKFPSGEERNGIKWMSFPSVDRLYGNNDMAHIFFEPLRDPNLLDEISWKYENDVVWKLIIGNELAWDGNNHEIHPQQGYKIKMNSSLQESVSFAIPAITPDISQQVRLKAYSSSSSKSPSPTNENWIGYFGKSRASVWDAFASIIHNLWYIQTQDWAIVREQLSPNSYWIQALSMQSATKPPVLKYGDTVIVKCFQDAEFCWNDDPVEYDGQQRRSTEHFSYKEKMEYIPIYVEFSGNDLPKEVAIYLDGKCCGAAVVDGSIIHIPAYILDSIYTDEDLEIVLYYDNKASYNPKPSFKTWNMETGTYEKRATSTNEMKPFYRFKIDNESINDVPMVKFDVKNYPNPFNPETTIQYSVTEKAEVDLCIFNLKGQLVKKLVSDTKSAGSHKVIWNGTDSNENNVVSGVYFAILSSGDKRVARKLLLMK